MASVRDLDRRRAGHAVAGVAFLIYLLLVGTFAGERWPIVRALGLIGGGVVIVGAALWIRHRTDALDRLSLGVLGVFLVACLVSTALRSSLDAAMTATAVTFAFLLAREALADPDARSAFIHVVSMAGTAAAIAFGLVWLGVWVAWGQAFDWRAAPPLDLPLPSGPFGYRHHVADFVALCAPAMVIRARQERGIDRLVALGGLALTAFIVVAAGSRMIWLACVVAGLVTVISQGGLARGITLIGTLRARLPRWAPLVAGGLAAAVVVVLAGPLLARITQLSPLEARTEIWARSVALGLERPLTGWGPGSFPFLLQRTDYFDFNVYAPRHPDNSAVMALAESGVLGLAALVAVWAFTAWFLLRRRAPAATVWAVVFFGLVSLTASPTDYGFLYAPFLGWIAYGLPRDSSPTDRSRLRYVALVALVPIAVAFASIGAAALAHEAARAKAADGEYELAEREAARATALDPALAIYWRDLGWVQLARGHPEEARGSFVAALARNPGDTPSLRGAALAAVATGSPGDGLDLALAGVEARRSDPRNALLAAFVASQAGEETTATRMAIEAIEQQPILASAPEWETVGFEAVPLLARAAEETLAGDGTTVGSRIPSLRVAWLAALAGEPALRPRALENASPYHREGELLLGFAECTLTSEDLLAQGPPFAPQFWEVRLILGSLIGVDGAKALAQSTLQLPSLERRASGDAFEPPLEHDGSVDHGGYRRRPVELREPIVALPSVDSAVWTWLSGSSVGDFGSRCP